MYQPGGTEHDPMIGGTEQNSLYNLDNPNYVPNGFRNIAENTTGQGSLQNAHYGHNGYPNNMANRPAANMAGPSTLVTLPPPSFMDDFKVWQYQLRSFKFRDAKFKRFLRICKGFQRIL